MYSLATSLEDRIETMSSKFPPPYKLDFQGRRASKLGEPQPLILSSSIPDLCIKINTTDPIYRFFIELCKRYRNHDGLASHELINDMVLSSESSKRTKKKIGQMIYDVVSARLLKNTGMTSAELKKLFFNIKGEGWELSSGVEIKGDPIDAYGRLIYQPNIPIREVGLSSKDKTEEDRDDIIDWKDKNDATGLDDDEILERIRGNEDSK
jgi:hypothetical protein